jgi:uncharacterized RDD family membrane protein YckC
MTISSAPIASIQEGDVDVVWRRVVQYVVDGFLSAMIAVPFAAVFYALPTGPDGAVRWPVVPVVLAVRWGVLAVAAYLWYWVLRPAATGKTWGMELIGVRIVRADGALLSRTDTLVRGLLLLVDGLFLGLVGLISMLATRDHQRIGDLVAKTLVVRDF